MEFLGTIRSVQRRKEDWGVIIFRISAFGDAADVDLDEEEQLLLDEAQAASKAGTLRAAGIIGDVNTGDTISLVGDIEHDANWGLQIKIQGCWLEVGESMEDLRRFISKHVGPRKAAAMLSGMDRTHVLDVLKSDMPCASEEWDKCRQAFVDTTERAESFRYLLDLDITPGMRARVFEDLGKRAGTALKKNPYILCAPPPDGPGWQFNDADTVAQACGIDLEDPRRKIGAAMCAINGRYDMGHTAHEWEEITTHKAINGLDEVFVSEGLEAALDERIVVEAAEDVLQIKSMQDAEKRIAAFFNRHKEVKADPTQDIFREGGAHRLFTSPDGMHFAGRSDVKFASIEAEKGRLDSLDSTQRDAVKKAFGSTLGISVLTGGPGTGKTFTTKTIVDLARDHGLRTMVMAPTGRAAAVSSKAIGVEATTIHRALKYVPDVGFYFNKQRKLQVDLLVVDESSMIDTELFASLVDAIPPMCRVVFVGDQDQLPPVNPGCPFADLLESEMLPTSRLETIHRQSEDSRIPYLARDIREGTAYIRMSGAGVKHAPAEGAGKIQRMLVAAATKSMRKETKDRRAFQPPEIQVLTAMRRGALGSRTLNLKLQQALNPGRDGDARVFIRDGHAARIGDRVIFTKNDYDLGQFNGDIGVVVDIGLTDGVLTPTGARDGTKIMAVQFENRKVPTLLTKQQTRKLDLAYALTVHKSQGGQFPCVLMPIDKSHSWMMTRRLLYTAVTRASEFVGLIGQADRAQKAAGNDRDAERDTLLVQRLKGEL